MNKSHWLLVVVSMSAASLCAYGCSGDDDTSPDGDAGTSTDGGGSSSGGSSSGGSSSGGSSSGGSSSGGSSSGGSSSGGSTDGGTDASADGGDTCTAITVPAGFAFAASGEADALVQGSFAPALIADAQNAFGIEFFGAPTVGEFVLGTGENASPATCSQCVRAIAGPDEQRYMFATQGTLSITAIDTGAKTVAAALTNVKLVEVTPDANGNPVPVANGACLTFTGPVSVD